VHEPSSPELAEDEDPKAEFHSLYEDEPPRSRVGVVVFLLIILGAVGFLGWQWRHGAFPFSQQTRSQRTAQSASTSEVAPAVDQNQSGQEAANRTSAEAENKTAETRQNTPTPARACRRARGIGTAENNATSEGQSAGENPAVPTAPDEDLEQSGERYLYGNDGPQGCTQAECKLSTAATHGNTKAQTVLGTMYATGHCVGRDLPRAYRWFARALRHDPQNSRIAQDLQVLWREMTPQERQLAKAS
jgi:TPR repeat protein